MSSFIDFNGGANKREPKCAKIWDYLYKRDNQFGDDMIDICASDMVSDNIGLTVILPDKHFRDSFHNEIHGDGSASKARRMVGNIAIRRFLENPEDWEQWKKSLPLRSGLTLPVTSVDGDIVTLDNTIELKKCDFKCPAGFRYAVWEVTKGKYPTTSDMPLGRKNKRGRKPIEGGGNEKGAFLINVGNLIKDSPDTMRVSLLTYILVDYRNELLRNRCAIRNPLMLKAASLYNWMSMYYPDTLECILPVTDIHPGVNLMLFVLDPKSPVTDTMLFGSGDSCDDIQTYKGWGGADSICTNAAKEWQGWVDQASNLVGAGKQDYYCNINTFRNHLITSTQLDGGTSGTYMKKLYCTIQDNKGYAFAGQKGGFRIFPEKTYNKMYAGSVNKDRKLWQDQLRYVATSSFAGAQEGVLVSAGALDDSFKQVVHFRPMQDYTTAATFTFTGGSYMSKDSFYLSMKWLFSTDFLYVPDSLGDDPQSLCFITCAPYDGTEYSNIRTKQILNNHHIKAQMTLAMRTPPSLPANLLYGLEWLAVSSGSSGDKCNFKDVVEQVKMTNKSESLAGGKATQKKKKKSKGHRKPTRGLAVSDSDDEEDADASRARALQNLTFFIGDVDNVEQGDSKQIIKNKKNQETGEGDLIDDNASDQSQDETSSEE
ncbi:MAG: hypothetical protein LWX54_03145 [Deltaproteobacteria bacterium]|jgi:hypothetical protein|nr:hypothetical protein [Deltaproteobacteria bacterium]